MTLRLSPSVRARNRSAFSAPARRSDVLVGAVAAQGRARRSVDGSRSNAADRQVDDQDLPAGAVQLVGDAGADAAAADDDGFHACSSGIASRTTQTAHGAFFRMYGMVRPIAKSPPNRRRNGSPQMMRSASALGRLVDDRRPDVAGLEEHGLEPVVGGLGRGLGDVEDPLGVLVAARDVGVERQRPVDLDDVDADQLGLGRAGELGREGDDRSGRSGRRTAPRRRAGTVVPTSRPRAWSLRDLGGPGRAIRGTSCAGRRAAPRYHRA